MKYSKYNKSLIASFLFLLLGMGLSLGAARIYTLNNQQEVRDHVDEEVEKLVDKISMRMYSYQYGLRGARAFILSSGDSLDRELFRHYADSRDLTKEFPGARGFGFIRRVLSEQEPGFLAHARRDGKPNFAIRQLSPHLDERYVIEYVEPMLNNEQAIGLDIASEVNRRTGAQKAVNSGEVQITAPITLVQVTGQPLQSFLMLLPVYKTWSTPVVSTERWQAAIGWAYAPLVTEDVISTLGVNREFFNIRLTDVGDFEKQVVFHQSEGFNAENAIIGSKVFTVCGRDWQVELEPRTQYISSLRQTNPWGVFGVGVIISFILALLIFVTAVVLHNKNELVKHQANLAAIVASTNDAILGMDLQGVVTAWNPGAATIFGFSAEEMLGKRVVDLLIPEELKAEEITILNQAKNGLPVQNMVSKRQKKNGEVFDALINVSPVFNMRGAVVGVSKTLRDISDIKAVERQMLELNVTLESRVQERTAELSKALRENTAILGTINAQYLFSVTDSAGKILEVNDNFCAASGFTREQLVGSNHRIINSKVHERQFWVDMWQQVMGGKPWHAEVCNRTSGGEFRWFDSVIAPILDANGKVERIIALRTDITTRKSIEADLSAARDQLSIAADVAKLGVWTWDVVTNQLHWNDRMYSMYQQPLYLKNHGLEYKHWRERVHPDDVGNAEQKLQDAVAGVGTFDPVFRIITPDQEVHYILAGAQIERDSFGNAKRVTGINLDITDQTLLEAELRHAKEMSEAASEAKSQFLANMSHEIRTPMNAVLGMLTLVKQTNLNIQQQDYIGKADTAARSLLGILNDILDFSKIAANKLVLDPIEFELEVMLRELAVVLAGNHGEKPVEIVFDIDPKLPRSVVADKLRLQQILINLAGNALKFTHQGHVAVRLRQQAISDTHVNIMVEIEDTGIGIAPEQQQRIFEGFVQAEASTSRRFGGSGLGLVISKRLLELMGADLQLHSQVGVGTRFFFALDLLIGAHSIASQAIPEASLTQLRVLIVDDNPLMKDVLGIGMQDAGCEVVTASSGTEALEKVAQADAEGRPYDVILMDWNMPEMNGLEASKLIRASENHEAKPLIIMVTAFERELLMQTAKLERRPFNELLVKPVTTKQVSEVIAKLGTQQTVPTAVDSKILNHDLDGFNILVVEDNELNRQVARELLTIVGARVVEAEGGLIGVEKVIKSGEHFDIVLMDLQMPDIDGFEATRRIRSDGRFARLPILAMTANASANDREACLQAGMDEHIGKPFDMNKLVPLILKLCGEGNYVASVDGVPVSTIDTAPLDTYPLIEPLESILSRFGNNAELALRMCSRFESETKSLFDKLVSSVGQQDSVAAIVAAHSLKGVGGTLGAIRLSKLAGRLEQQLRSGNLPSDEEIRAVYTLIHTSLAVYNELDFQLPSTSSTPTLSREQLLLLTAQLQGYLREDNMNAVDLCHQVAAALGGDPLAQLLNEQASELNFGAAIITLETLVEKIAHAAA